MMLFGLLRLIAVGSTCISPVEVFSLGYSLLAGWLEIKL